MRGLAHHGESLRQNLLERLALAQPLLELRGLGGQIAVRQCLSPASKALIFSTVLFIWRSSRSFRAAENARQMRFNMV